MEWLAAFILCALCSLTSAATTADSQLNHSHLSPPPANPSQRSSTAAPAASSTSAPSGGSGQGGSPCSFAKSCCGTSTITATAALNTLSACATFQGDLTLSSIQVVPAATIGIPFDAIAGSLEISNIAGEVGVGYGFAFDTLSSVSGNITFANLTNVRMPAFSALTSAGSMAFQNVIFYGSPSAFQTDTTYNQLPALNSLGSLEFTGTNVTAIGPFSTDNLGEKSITVIDNALLRSVDIGSSDFSTDVSIQDNGALQEASLAIGATDTAIIKNNSLTSLSLSSLTSVEKLLEIEENPQLSNLETPQLKLLAGKLIIKDNDNLHSIDLALLSTVSSIIDIEGPINQLQINSSLTDNGSIYVDSSGGLNCGPIRAIKQANGQHAQCGNKAHPLTASPPSPSTSSAASGGPNAGSSSGGGGGGGLSSSATIGIGVGVGVGGALLLAAAAFFCWRSRRKGSRSQHGASSATYSKPPQSYGASGEHFSYREVPYDTSRTKEMREPPASEDDSPSTMVGMSDAWVPPEPTVQSASGRTELEEQQGARHEMDARSIDFDDDDDDAETRSLEDIERVHRQR